MPSKSERKLAKSKRQGRINTSIPQPEAKELVGPLGLAAAIRRLQEAELQAHAAYEQSVVKGVGVFDRMNEWTRLVEQLRKTEKDIGEINRDRAETLPVADVEREWARMVRMLFQQIEARDRAMPDRLDGMDKPTMLEVLNKTRKEIFELISKKQWRDDTQTPAN